MPHLCLFVMLLCVHVLCRHFGIYDDAKDLLQSADTNGDGMIDYAEFSWLLRSQNEGLKASARAEVKGQLAKFF